MTLVNQPKSALPFPNGFAPNTANFIKGLQFHECSVPFQVYVETFIPCFIEMLIAISIWDFNDLIRASGEAVKDPPGRRGTKHRRHIKKTRFPKGKGVVNATASNGLNHVLKWSEPLEKIGYVILLYNATERFFYNWNSALYGFEHCGKPPSEGPLQKHADPHLTTSPAAWENVTLANTDQNRAGWPNGIWNATVPRGWYSVTFEVTFRNIASTPIEIEVGLQASLSTLLGVKSSGKATIEVGGSGAQVIHENIYFPLLTGGQITWLKRSSPVPIGIFIESASVSIYSFQPGR